MVFSASSARSLLNSGGNGFYYLERTVIFGAIGLVVMRVASVRGVAAARVMTPLILLTSLFLLFAVLLPGVGTTVNGAQRWVGGGLVQFQPSELAKIALVLYGAYLLSAEPKRVQDPGRPGPLPADRRPVGPADRQGARPGHRDRRLVRGLLRPLPRRRQAADAGAGRRDDRVRRRGDDRDAPLPGGPPHRLPPSRQRHQRRRASRRSRRPSRSAPAGSPASGSARASRRPPISPRPTRT